MGNNIYNNTVQILENACKGGGLRLDNKMY